MIRLAAASRVVRVVTLAAHARQMLPGDELELDWRLVQGVPWPARVRVVLAEAQLAIASSDLPGAFTDEVLARDARQAGLELVRRDGDVVTLRREQHLPNRVRPRLGLADAIRCVGLVLRAERLIRQHPSPTALVERARQIGALASPRNRAELRADLALLEPLVPGRRGCLRRVVAELAGDPEAAREPVVLGLTPHATGHASFAHTTPWAPEHPVAFVLTAEPSTRVPGPAFG